MTLTPEAGAAMTVRTYWVWETTPMLTTPTLHLLGGAQATWAPTWEERGGGISCRHPHSLLVNAGQNQALSAYIVFF